jgi:type I restriction enzyme, S subunit
LSDLPAGWELAPIGVIADVVSGQAPPGTSYNDRGQGLPLYQGKTDFGELRIQAPRLWTTSPSKLAQTDDVLLSVRAPVGPTNLATGRCAIGRGLAALRGHPGIEQKYILYAIRATVDRLSAHATGTTFAAITAPVIREHAIPVAPTAEQKRIVSAIEEQFSRIDAAGEALERAVNGLRRLRAALLEAAVTRRLVSGEPIADPSLGPSTHAPDPSKPKQDGRVRSPRAAPLPDGWTWHDIQEVCDSVTDGDHQPPPKAESGVPFLVIGNVRSGTIDFAGSRHVPQDYYDSLRATRQPRKDDVLYTLVGSYGIPVLVTDDRPFCVQRHIGILRPSKIVDPAFLAVVMASSSVLAQARACATGTAQMTVPLSGLRRIQVPIPPVGEQRRIVAKLDACEHFCGQLSETTARLVRRAGSLRSSILSAAFSGKLVSQNSEDEPALLLLERIRSDRAKLRGGKSDGNGPGLTLRPAAAIA